MNERLILLQQWATVAFISNAGIDHVGTLLAPSSSSPNNRVRNSSRMNTPKLANGDI